ncbi:unnamed protein product [Symbiodinium necroappetens]|uniref:Uncharacterized protein n=1 Tax=Symbiodinium necroappetens TaxID=1628268 RepID=A0A813AQM1_9DINO|nr:unnamed protein product [Symbiodinium necroappetens]
MPGDETLSASSRVNKIPILSTLAKSASQDAKLCFAARGPVPWAVVRQKRCPVGRIVYFAVSYMVIQAGRGPGFASTPWLATAACAHCLCRAALARERVALTFPGMKRPAQNRNHGTSNAALLSVLRKIPKGQTRSKMEVFRQVLQELGRGDEGIDTGIRAQLGSQLQAVVAQRAHGWHRVVSSDGGFWNKEQLPLLQTEGARPRSGESVLSWAGRCKAIFVATYRASSGRLALTCHDPRVEKWQPEAVEPLHSKATLKERLVLSGGKFFFHPDIPKPLPPAFPRKRSSQKKPCKTFKAAMKMVRPRLHQALGAAEFAELQRTGAVRLRSILHSEECAELLDFASRANFPDVRRLDGEAGRGGAYHFCEGSPPPLVEAIRTSLYESILDHLPSLSQRFGKSLADLEKRCRAAGQRRSATIFLAFGEGGVNLAHQEAGGRFGQSLQQRLASTRREGTSWDGGPRLAKGKYPAFDVDPDANQQAVARTWRSKGRLAVTLPRRTGPSRSCALRRGSAGSGSGEASPLSEVTSRKTARTQGIQTAATTGDRVSLGGFDTCLVFTTSRFLTK